MWRKPKQYSRVGSGQAGALGKPDVPGDPQLRQPPDGQEKPHLLVPGITDAVHPVAFVHQITRQFACRVDAGIRVPQLAAADHQPEHERSADDQRNGVAHLLDAHLGCAAGEEVADEGGTAVGKPHPDPVKLHLWNLRLTDRVRVVGLSGFVVEPSTLIGRERDK